MHERMRIALCTAGLVLLIWSRTAAAQEYYGVPIEDSGVAFLLDVSGSMEGKDEKLGQVGGSALNRLAQAARNTAVGRSRVGQMVIDRALSETTKMGAARRALIHALGTLNDGTSFTVVTFGNSANEWPGGVRLSGRAATMFAQGFVASLSATGDTPMAEALTLGFRSPDVGTLFVVSDGKPTTGEVLGLVRQLQEGRKGSRMVINTIGIGGDQDPDLLCQLATENGGVYVRDGVVACSYSPCPADPGLVTYYPAGPRRHYYPHRTDICSSAKNAKCTPELVYETMLSEARFQAPTRERTNVTTCGRLDLRIFDWLMLTRPADPLLKLLDKGMDPVTVVVDRGHLAAINYTRPGHDFHPGKVTRTVKQDGDVVYVETIGTGTGDDKAKNEAVGPVIFGWVDDDLRAAVKDRLAARKAGR